MTENRRRVIRVSKKVFEMMLTGSDHGYTSSMPEDLEVIQVLETDRLAACSAEFRIVVQSKTFEPVREGLAIPEINPTFTRIEPEKREVHEAMHGHGDEPIGKRPDPPAPPNPKRS